jgi:hypothetical protein
MREKRVAIEVEFIGLCLFRRPPTVSAAVEVLLPGAQNRSGERHPDGSEARPHWAYVVVPEAMVSERSANFEVQGGLVQEPLVGTMVDFGVTGGIPAIDELTDLVSLTRFTTCVERRQEAVVSRPDILAGEMHLRGGRLYTDATSPAGPWEFNETLRPKHGYRPSTLAWRIRWDTGHDRLTIRFRDGVSNEVKQLTVGTSGDAVITVGNVCEPDPAQWNALPVRPALPGEAITDDDFKWMYRVLSPCGSITWKDLLAGRPLPAPTYTAPAGPATRGVSTPTCFGGCYGDECD